MNPAEAWSDINRLLVDFRDAYNERDVTSCFALASEVARLLWLLASRAGRKG